MAFLPNIPQATDQLSVSQGNILNNFTILGAIAGNTNASSASINATSGFNWLYLPPQSATPPGGSAFTVGNIGLYSAANATSTQNELYINKQNQATTVQVPATASILSANSAPVSGSAGWSYLPSGIILQWANSTPIGDNTNGITLNFAITFPNRCLQVLVSATGPIPSTFPSIPIIAVTSVSTTNFTFSTRNPSASPSGTVCGINYLAIGY